VKNEISLEEAANALSESSDFRVLRRLSLRPRTNDVLKGDRLVGIVLDVETTGLDVDVDEIIELAMLKFYFDRDGHVGQVIDKFHAFNQPENAISGSITKLTGITNETVAGQKVSVQAVNAFILDAAIIIAHNAAFDRPFCEKRNSHFVEFPWGCSATEIPWRDEGIVGSRLEYIAQSFNFFYDAHRAENDCEAVVELLSFRLPQSNQQVMEALLKRARRSEIRIFATGASYDLRILLKKRGYRWNGNLNLFPRAWWLDVEPSAADDEISFLEEIDPSIRPETFKMTARNRFRGIPD
jgi:DNA polymerase-3 subunit epsilon